MEEDDWGQVLFIDARHAESVMADCAAIRLVHSSRGPNGSFAGCHVISTPDDISERRISFVSLVDMLEVPSSLVPVRFWNGLLDDTLLALRADSATWLLRLREDETVTYLGLDLSGLNSIKLRDWQRILGWAQSNGLLFVDFRAAMILEPGSVRLSDYLDWLK